MRIKDACAGMVWNDMTKKLTGWIAEEKVALIALDAPLGWPVALRSSLQCHKAGEPLQRQKAGKPVWSLDEGDEIFYRQTELKIKKCYKPPFAVGADKVARTAHAALLLLDELRKNTSENIRLAWDSNDLEETRAIEVYPAATLIAHVGKEAAQIGKKFKSLSEEKKFQKKKEKILAQLENAVCLNTNAKKKIFAEKRAQNALDAVLCVLAAADFVRGHAAPPEDRTLAEKEGWIWVKKSLQADAR